MKVLGVLNIPKGIINLYNPFWDLKIVFQLSLGLILIRWYPLHAISENHWESASSSNISSS